VHVHRSSDVCCVDFESVVHVQERIELVVEQLVQLDVYEPPAIPQQLRTPLVFEMMVVMGHEHRSSVAATAELALLVQLQDRMLSATPQPEQLDVNVPDGVPQDAASSPLDPSVEVPLASAAASDGAVASADPPMTAGGPPS
jgi:hypothetical protein